MTLDAQAMTHDEAMNAGLKPFVDGSFDNYAIDAMLNNPGMAQNDARGRPIISYAQYQEMSRRDMRVDNYVLRMVGPAGKGLIQASKYNKYWGEGYRPIEMVEAARRRARKTLDEYEEREARAPKAAVVDEDQIVIYRCAEKYSFCNRFFDSRRALETHWGMPQPSGHGEKKIKKAAKAPVQAQEADDDEIPFSYTPERIVIDG